MSKIAVCYFSYYKDIDFLNESLKVLHKTINRHPEHEVRVYVYDDSRAKKNIKKSAILSPCTLISTSFNRNGNLNGYECINGMFDEYKKLQQRFDYDYLIKLDSDCVLNSFDYLTAAEIQLKKENKFDKVSQIGSYFAYLCCYGCCEAFTKHGIELIHNLFQHMNNSSLPDAIRLKKRVELGWNEDKVVSILMEMTPSLRIPTSIIGGINGHINAFANKDQDWSSYSSVAFKPYFYGEKLWSRDESLEKIRSFAVNSPNYENNSFYNFVKGKNIAVVSNADLDKDYSAEIDSADIVIRFNNFYNYQSGKAGTKVDALVISKVCAFMRQAPNGTSTQDMIIANKKPAIFVLSEAENQNFSKLHPRYDGCEINMLGNKAVDMRYTTGTIVLKMLSEMEDVNVKYYGFEDNNKWQNYINSYAIHHKNICGTLEEAELREKILKKIDEK
jgi:hypothetical protein